MCLTVSYGCLLSILLPWSCCLSLTLSFSCWLSLTVSQCVIELLHISHFLIWGLAAFHLLSLYHGIAVRLSLSPMYSGFLSLSLLVLWSCCMSLTVS